ncbi:arginine/serine-rich protein 1-like isoform X2 [Choloepus didactylus]|uniref:arginine/serine-rich protein 1-like isoform X2 n=1 Tax=Choloepus didactylus TaxID=27675 RepID=UPI00189DF64A|nr:arginine/serine-rich protein 1-like isoform X2 [Choloepus didactylus]
MSNYVNDMWPGSPQKDSPSTSGSGQSCRLSSSRSSSRLSSRSARSGSRVSSRSSSRSRSRPRRRSRSRSRCRRRHQRTYRRYSRSYSRSRSLSRSRRHRERHRGSSRRVYPEEYGSRRARSRTRSRSRSPFRLSEKERMELLEIAKANAAKALGTAHLDLPASLRTASVTKEKNCETASPNDGAEFKLLEKLTEDGTKNRNEKSSQQRSIAFSAYNSVAKPIFQKSAKATVEDTSSGSPKLDKKKSPYELWVPV